MSRQEKTIQISYNPKSLACHIEFGNDLAFLNRSGSITLSTLRTLLLDIEDQPKRDFVATRVLKHIAKIIKENPSITDSSLFNRSLCEFFTPINVPGFVSLHTINFINDSIEKSFRFYSEKYDDITKGLPVPALPFSL